MAESSAPAELDYLDLCGNTVRNLEDVLARGERLLNPRQCEDLSSKLSTITRNVRELVLYCQASIASFRPALENLYRCLENAEALVSSCGEDDWCTAAVLQIQNESTFRLILLDVSSCYKTIYELAKSTSKEWNGAPEDLQRSSVFGPAMAEDVHTDQLDLEKRLNDSAQVVFLSLCRKTVLCIRNLVKSDKVLLNQRQCADLSTKLCIAALNVFQLVSRGGASVVRFQLALESLYRFLEKAKALVSSCAEDDWLVAAVFQIDNENAFRMILLDVSLCYNAIYELAKSTSTDWDNPPEDLREPPSLAFTPAPNSDVDEDKLQLQMRLDDLAYGYTRFKLTDYSVPGKMSRTQSLAEYLLVKMCSTPLNPREVALSTYSAMRWREVSEPMFTWGSSGFLGYVGSGSTSKVVSTTWLGIPCARKEFHGESNERIFRKEAGILAHLKHPCIVNFVCCGNGLEKGDYFIAMELMEMSLAALIEKQKGAHFPLPIVVDIMMQIARGMCYLHERGVVHFDLKPGNVVVNRLTSPHMENHYCVKLIDFGTAKVVSKENTMLAQGTGTVLYRAPELSHQAHPDGSGKAAWFKADVYSFAVTSAHLLSLRTPFEGMPRLKLYKNLMIGVRPSLPVECPIMLKVLLENCWSTRPKARPTFKEVCTRLENFKYGLLKGFVGGEESDESNVVGFDFIKRKVEEQSSNQVMLVDTNDDDEEMLPQSDSIQNLISSTMTSLGVQQSSTKVEYGSGDYIQDFQGHVGGSLGGRFNAELMEIQILFSSLGSMVSVIGLGLKLDPNQLVLVTLSACDSSKVVMTRLEKEECEKMTSSGGAFYMIHFDVDIDEDQDHIMKLRPQTSPPTSSGSDSSIASAMEFEEYKGVDEIEEDPSMYVACRAHTFAKLILLLTCNETHDVPLLEVKEFLSVWDWKDVKMALREYEEERENIANYNHELVNTRSRGDEGGNDSTGDFHGASNLPSNNKGKAKRNQSGASFGGGSGMGGGGGDGGEDGDDFDRGHQRLSMSSPSNSQEEKSYSIEVRPGYGCYEERENNTSWPYKSILVFATPVITISFRNCFNRDSKEVHAKLEVNFDLANDSDPSASDLEKNRFAWYHDSFEFSIQCIDDGAAELKVGSGSVHNLEPVRSTVSNMTTRNSKSSQKAFLTELKTSALLPVQNTTKVSYTRSGPSSSLAVGEMRENLNRETAQGFLAREKFEGGSRPRIGCAFKHAKSKDIESYIHEAYGRLPDMERYLDEDMCSSQAQVIEGAFRPRAEKKHYYAYSFNCYRRIAGFFWAEITEDRSSIQKWKQKLLCKADGTSVVNTKPCKKVTCEQRFDVALYINHGMKHIHKLAMECPDGIPPLRGGDKHRRVLAADRLKDNNVQPEVNLLRKTGQNQLYLN